VTFSRKFNWKRKSCIKSRPRSIFSTKGQGNTYRQSRI